MHKQLEDYLSKIEKQLAALPAQQREDELREMRSHLEMMIEENVARGYDADQAVAKALEQFGAAKKVGRDLKNAPNSKTKIRRILLLKVLRFVATMIATSVMFLDCTKSPFIPHLLSFSPRLDHCSMIVVDFLVGWTVQFLNPGNTTVSFSDKVIFLSCLIISLGGIFLIMTSSSNVLSNMSNFTVPALVAGTGVRRLQKEYQTALSS